MKQGDGALSLKSAYVYGACVGALLDRVLQRATKIIEITRLYMPPKRKTAIGIHAEKQNLEHTFVFGHLLQTICDRLDLSTVVDAPLPIQFMLENGQSFTRSAGTGAPSVEEKSKLGSRYPLANLRIEVELMMFIGQTGMNLAQAQTLTLRQFFYISHTDGFQIKDHKARRGGAVLFEIFKDFRPHFERYLTWRAELFPLSNYLFPFVRAKGSRTDSRFQAHRIRAICADSGVPFIGPQSLRNTRVNWMLRRSGDPELTAETAQHTKKTLLQVYELPSLQRAMVEVTRFWNKADPHLVRTQALAPGDCDGAPEPVHEIPREAPRPDCEKASGCLWCKHHRDVDSLDYIWALVSFRHLKEIEISAIRTPISELKAEPAEHSKDRINKKLKWFRDSNSNRSGWVAEGEARIEEGDYHPHWRSAIVALEGNT